MRTTSQQNRIRKKWAWLLLVALITLSACQIGERMTENGKKEQVFRVSRDTIITDEGDTLVYEINVRRINKQ